MSFEQPIRLNRKLKGAQNREKKVHRGKIFGHRYKSQCCGGVKMHPHRRPLNIVGGTCFNYMARLCDDLQNCEDKNCVFAHNNWELVYHPRIYKTKLCPNIKTCTYGENCSLAHGEKDQRVLRRIYGENWQSWFMDPRDVVEVHQATRRRRRRRQGAVIGSSAPPQNAWSVQAVASPAPSDAGSSISASVSRISSSIDPFSSPDEKSSVESQEKNELEQWMDDQDVGVGRQRDLMKRKFREAGLVDLDFLLDLCTDNQEFLKNFLMNVCGLNLGLSNQIVRGMEEYRLTISTWLERVVCLPKYADLFYEMGFCSLKDIEDVEKFLAEMRSQNSVGNQCDFQRISYYLRKYGVSRLQAGECDE